MRQLLLGSLIVLATAAQAGANGRPAGTSSIHWKQGSSQDIIAGMTFGLVVSHDGGATWQWMCEKAVGYGGMYDPRYVYTNTGAIFATTFDGLKVMRDACVFGPTPQGANFVSTVTAGPDHAIYSTTATPADPNATPPNPGDSKIYKSINDGVTFPTSATPGQVNDWWQTIEVAPSDPQRVYLSGYRMTGSGTTFLMFRSTNGGTSYTAMSQTGFTTSSSSQIDIVGISATNPDEVYARVTYQMQSVLSDGIYKNINGGIGTWTKILDKPASISFVVRSNGDLVAGTQTAGSFVSHDKGATWIPLTNPPHINCLVESPSHEVWACTQNYGSMTAPSDDAGIMKSTDLTTWTKVLRYQEIQAPVACPSGTAQHDQCAAVSTWCPLKNQFGITNDTSGIPCPAVFDAPPTGGDTTMVTSPPKGCCDTGAGSSTGWLVIGLGVGMVLVRRRR